MTPRKFVGSTTRAALQKVKQALGDDALIVSNRTVAGGIEITALVASALTPEAAPAATPVAPRAAAPAATVARQAAAAPTSAQHPDPDGLVQHLMREVSAMKALLQRELSGVPWADIGQRAPVHAATMQTLLSAGFSPALSRELIAAIPADATAAAARKLIDAQIERRLTLARSEELVEQGGVYALIGPTGVGKTTTLAKLAARCVVRNGADSLALLTTDSYRIAGHDQLRIYGKILGVPVHAIKDVEDLKATLGDLGNKKTILIDTIGMSQRDRLVAEQSALLAGGAEVKRLLLLNATANAATLDEVIRAYAPNGVHGCIITKVDESASVATALDGAIRHSLNVNYVTNGQRVPEDLHLPKLAYLMHRALQSIKDSAAHGLRSEEYGLVMGAEMEGASMADLCNDQAAGLRKLLHKGGVRIMTVASGSHGMGRTSAVVNIAAALAASGRGVLVIDENYGPANVAGLLGVRARFDLQDVIRQDCSLEEALIHGPRGIAVLPAARGAASLPGLRQLEQARLVEAFGCMDDRFDVVLVDTHSRNSAHPGFFSRAVPDTIVVSSAAAPAITESYALIKRMGRDRGARRFYLLLNRITSEPTARLIFDNMERVARTHLDTPLESLGSVPRDDSVGTASRMFQPVVEAFPTSPSATGFRRIAESIAGWPGVRDGTRTLDSLMQRLLSSQFNLATAGA